jgi:AraC-like DNA-binding protein
MDLLADALSVIHFKGTVYCQTDFTAPWGVDWEQRSGHAGFFMVMRGGCYMEADAFPEPLPLRAGDFVLSPKAMGYILRDSPGSRAARFDDVAGAPDTVSRHRIIRYGGGGPSTKLMMGCFELDETSNNPLVLSLPDFIVVRSEELQDVPWLETTLRFLSAECVEEKLGSSIAISRLTELLFVQSIRFFMRQEGKGADQNNWLKGAADPYIGKALAHMHENPGTDWTVLALADKVGMSRSAFALRFKELTNNTPLEYLTSWRMHKAEKLIGDGTASLAEIAATVGYQSESAFCKAFKREKGAAPGVFRRQAGQR